MSARNEVDILICIWIGLEAHSRESYENSKCFALEESENIGQQIEMELDMGIWVYFAW